MANELDLPAELCSVIADPRSRAAFEEAARCFRAKAYRSAMVALWVSVVFDLMLKAESFASHVASPTCDEVKEARKDKNKMLKLEQVILDYALTGLCLIDRYEYVQLERLRQDRCSFAHAEFSDSDTLMAPDADSVMFAMTLAVKAVLSKPAGRKPMVAPLEGAKPACVPSLAVRPAPAPVNENRAPAPPASWANFVQALQRESNEAAALKLGEPILVNLTSVQFTKIINVLVTSKAMRDKSSVYERLYKAAGRHNLPDIKAVKRLQAATLSDEAAAQARQKLCRRLNDMVEIRSCH